MRTGAIDRRPAGARISHASVVLLALVFLVLHLPYLPTSLEDLDSINFALGVRHFDVALHQPHPPGYPVFIAAAKAMRAVVRSEATALALVNVLAGALGVIAMAVVFRRVERDDGWRAWLPATMIAMTAPLYWFTAVRPLSDMAGLAAALAVQALTLTAQTTMGLATAGFGAGLAAGLRSQAAWLTVPLLIVQGVRAVDRRPNGNRHTSGVLREGPEPRGAAPSGRPSQSAVVQSLVAAAAAFIAGILLWLVPLLAISGGPAAYWRALSNQGAEDLGNITMLWTKHDLRTVADALYYALVAPWTTWTVAIVVLVCVALGAAWLWRSNRTALALLIVAFGPYFVFDLLFQETFTGRYALPLVVPLAYLAATGTRWLPANAGVFVALAIAMFNAHVGGTSIAAYTRQKPPAFGLLDDMASAGRSGRPPVLAMDRRNSFDFRRPLLWVDGGLPRFERTLAAPAQHEWLEAMRYWNSGGRAPLWFVVDPKRTSIDLVQHGEPARYRWALPYPVLVSGARPDEMDWYRVDRPEWYVGEGWSLTPEAAGVADADRRGLAFGPIHAGISRSVVSGGGTIMIGGRSFDPALHPRLTASIDGAVLVDEPVSPGAFLAIALPPATGAGDYAALTISTTPPAPVAIEQFDASATRPLAGFGAGWHEPEFNPVTGLRWRWLSERGELKVALPRASPGAARLTLHLEGESPRKYFSRGSHLRVRLGGRIVFDQILDADFAVDVPIDDRVESIVLETDQVYVPAERSRRTQDRRHLGLRILRCELK
jgi:hypothetical protein